MSSTLKVIRQRRERRRNLRRSAEGRTLRLGFGFAFILSVLVALFILAAVLAYVSLTRNLPSVQALPILLNPQDGLLLQPTRIYDRTGQHLLLTLAPPGISPSYIPYDRLPSSLVDATLALADPNFWDHPGYLIQGWQNPSLHPTLAQKLASDLLLWDEPPSIRRAIRERILAAQLTAVYGRQQVLEWALNSAAYGNDAWGIQSAAQLYLGLSAENLDLSQSALLAAVGQAPALNPLDAPQAAEERREQTLQIMFDMGMISSSSFPPAPSLRTPSPASEIAPAFTSLVLTQLAETFDRQRIARGGLVIRTTLDYDLQLQVACAVAAQTLRLSAGQAEITAADGSACEAARLMPALPSSTVLESASASAMVLDPKTGQVIAAVGETTAGKESALLSAHPAGTLLTPFIYLTGFTRGLGPASLAWDIPGSVESLDGEYRGPLRLRTALVNDILPPASALIEQMGSANVIHTAASFGLNLPSDYTLLSGELTLLQAAQSYSVFAADGLLAGQSLSSADFQPSTVLEVTASDHAVWLDWNSPQRRVVASSQLAYLMNHILSDETARWLSLGHPNPLEIGPPAGAKLGQTRSGLDAWTAGYTPQRLVVVWVGSPDEIVPLSVAASLWHGLIQYASRDLPAETWNMPPGVTVLEVCDPSGLLPADSCPSLVSEVFLAGNEPTQTDTLYQVFQVNRETGFLATVFTPPQLVERRIYLAVPPEAREWADASSLPVPPSTYDTIQAPQSDPQVHITSPALFTEVGGSLEITGSASSADFAWYRLEYGPGLNPQTWLQIGADIAQPVDEGLLAIWDTRGLNGLYALRLLVVRTDLRLERAVTLITLKNP